MIWGGEGYVPTYIRDGFPIIGFNFQKGKFDLSGFCEIAVSSVCVGIWLYGLFERLYRQASLRISTRLVPRVLFHGYCLSSANASSMPEHVLCNWRVFNPIPLKISARPFDPSFFGGASEKKKTREALGILAGVNIWSVKHTAWVNFLTSLPHSTKPLLEAFYWPRKSQ